MGEVPFEEIIYKDILESLNDTTYSQAQITSIEDFFINVLGNRGYAFAEVTGNPEINEDANEVKLIFSIQPGNRTYTRKILFTGNDDSTGSGVRAKIALRNNAYYHAERMQFHVSPPNTTTDQTSASNHNGLAATLFKGTETSILHIGDSTPLNIGTAYNEATLCIGQHFGIYADNNSGVNTGENLISSAQTTSNNANQYLVNSGTPITISSIVTKNFDDVKSTVMDSPVSGNDFTANLVLSSTLTIGGTVSMNGSNNATTTSDASNTNATIRFYDDAKISTAQNKFGGSSLFLSGESDHLLIDYTNDLNLDDRDFTIEWWEYRLAP